MFKEDGSVLHFSNPKVYLSTLEQILKRRVSEQVQASPQVNTFAISGQAETKQVSEMLPSIVNQLGPEGFASLRKLAMEKVGGDAAAAAAPAVVAEEPAKDDDVPELEGDFEEASKQEEEQAKAVSALYE